MVNHAKEDAPWDRLKTRLLENAIRAHSVTSAPLVNTRQCATMQWQTLGATVAQTRRLETQCLSPIWIIPWMLRCSLARRALLRANTITSSSLANVYRAQSTGRGLLLRRTSMKSFLTGTRRLMLLRNRAEAAGVSSAH